MTAQTLRAVLEPVKINHNVAMNDKIAKRSIMNQELHSKHVIRQVLLHTQLT